MQKGILIFQHAIHTDKQVFHKNLEKDESIKEILDEMGSNFMQLEIDHFTQFTTVLISKKGKQTIKCRKKIGQSDSTKEIELSHNRVKNYILKEGTPIPFLIDLGIQTIDGKVVKSKYDKFKQINRYLEFIEDVMDEFKEKQVLTILDFGCGKAYLTFAMYYYFTEIAKKQVKMIGLDLKEEVINNCNNLSQKYGFYGLEFRKGNIEDYNSAQSIDMVVTLHACDTATDYAIYKAIKIGRASCRERVYVRV